MGGVWVGSHRPPPAREPETRRLAGRGRWGGHLSGRATARNWESRGRWTEGVGCSCPPEPDPLCLRTTVVSSTRGGVPQDWGSGRLSGEPFICLGSLTTNICRL